MSPRRKIALLGSLYLAQGLPFGFFTQALPALLRAMELSLPLIGATSLLALPWALKFLWAPLVDRTFLPAVGRRRSWILPLQLAAAATMLLVGAADPEEQLVLVLLAVFVANLLAATQDIATDGLAVQVLTPAERGLGNGVQVAGYRVGMIVGGGALLVSFEALGWAGTFCAMAAMLVLATLPIALHREAPSAAPPPDASTLGVLTGFAKGPGMPGWIAFIATYKLGEALAGGMVRPMLVDLGLTLGEIGWLLGTGGFLAGLLGALAGGWLVGPLGRYPALLLFGVLQALTVATWALGPSVGAALPVLTAIAVVEHFVGGMATVALFTLMMDACRPETGGADYTLQASVVVLSTGSAAAVSGVVANFWGYEATFLLGALLSLLPLVPLAVVASRGGFPFGRTSG